MAPSTRPAVLELRGIHKVYGQGEGEEEERAGPRRAGPLTSEG